MKSAVRTPASFAGPLALLILSAGLGGLAACDDDGGGDTGDGSGAADAAPSADAYVTSPLVEARPYHLIVPGSYDEATPTPLVLMLHGYSVPAIQQAAYFQITLDVEEHGYLLAYPDGTIDSSGKPFWNATDGCCNFDNSPVDDVAYLNAVLDDVAAQFNVDPKRIFLLGHSNGGFMSHRFSCEHGDRVAAMVSLAGAQWSDPSRCPAADAVSVLQIHGDNDSIINFNGGMNSGLTIYPSAGMTVAVWAAKNGCTGPIMPGTAFDLVSSLAGAETTPSAYADCPAGGAVELWQIAGGSHIPTRHGDLMGRVWGLQEGHPEP